MTEALAIHVDAPLIDGEDPGTMRAADARRWIEIYSRLIEFKDELLERVGRRPAMAAAVAATSRPMSRSC